MSKAAPPQNIAITLHMMAQKSLIALVQLAVGLGGIGLLLVGLPSQAQTTASVTLAWNPSASSGIAGYRLHYGTSSGTYPNVIDVGNTITATVSRLTAGQTITSLPPPTTPLGLKVCPQMKCRSLPVPTYRLLQILQRLSGTISISVL